ncbi:MAG: hypothetical protein KTR17_05315 [Cellvibrionaceae bacterium]|nr:hypothetical protein [Cellvibrionaceae bacterium]
MSNALGIYSVDGVIDTTGAGDAFNAGYLSARIQGSSPREAAQLGIHLASIVIRNRGAIVKREGFFELYRGLQAETATPD